MRQRLVSCKGETLLGVVLALAIFSVSAFLLGSVLANAMRVMYIANAQSTADFIAFQVEQQMMAEKFTDIQPGTNTTTVANYSGYAQTVTVVQYTLDSVEYDAVTVTVSYPGAGNNSSGTRQLEFYRANFA